VAATARRIAETDRRAAQIAVVCATNKRLKADIEGRRWPVQVTALGYVDAMSDLMHASDLIVTKAGPGTIAEASIRGLPMALYGYIPGQEAANVDHVVDAGAGFFEPDAERLGAEVARLVTTDHERLRAMAAHARALGRARATHDIVASILARQ
jgi:1,2-diacylglycerol 3-beta-galactosyltransferase